jgi:hypothetical protein
MANLPTVGGSDGSWGSDLNTFLQVGHDADGTHNKTQMLTDMGWSPTAYAGGSTIAFPNGLIFRFGHVADANTTGTGTVNFPTGTIAVLCTMTDEAAPSNAIAITTWDKNTFGWIKPAGVNGFSYLAIGY